MEKDIPPDLLECINFHGHLCPGLTIGYLASKIAVRKMRLKRRAEDEELLCIAMSDGCAVDAIQYMTGCTLGKGNLIFQDFGKMVFIFLRRRGKKSGTGLRLSFQFPKALKNKSHKKNISREDAALTLLDNPEESYFAIQKLQSYPVPARARIFPSQKCAICGELTMEPRLRIKDGKMLCPECFPGDYSRGW